MREVGRRCRVMGSGIAVCYQFISKVLGGVKVRAPVQVEIFHAEIGKSFPVMLEQDRGKLLSQCWNVTVL